MNIKKSTLKKTALIIAGLILLTILVLFNTNNNQPNTSQDSNVKGAITMDGDKQILAMDVRGGYTPSIINAKANTPGILRMTTANSFDCSTAVVISKLNYRNNLPYTGVTDLEIPPQPAGTTIAGNCSMGMYSFKITFN